MEEHKHNWGILRACWCGAQQCAGMVYPELKEPGQGTDGRSPLSGYKFGKASKPRPVPPRRCTNAEGECSLHQHVASEAK